MILKSLRLVDFKNIEEAEMSFSSTFNCFVGNNGAGKTAILDAIHYLCLCKGFLHGYDNLNVRNDQNLFAVDGVFGLGEEDSRVQCAFKAQGKKSMRWNGKEYKRLIDHVGKIPIALITPTDADLVNGGSEVRRRFVDSAISQLNRKYLEELVRYNKVLQQRNALLKQFAYSGSFSLDALSVWDVQLAEAGQNIYNTRKEFLEKLIPLTNEIYQKLSSNSEDIGLEYRSQLSVGALSNLLESSVHKDRAAKHTTSGIHKDDVILTIHGQPLKRFGSQGQQKSALIALKLAQYQMLKSDTGQTPILLLDDIFDKLDSDRVGQLLKIVGQSGQVFITDTHQERVTDLLKSEIEMCVFKVTSGAVSQV
ncbi:MAG: DNA replication and repair protein RecF [Flavobacteriales bacterium]|jgi:DNA replication and repair protein RecF